VQHVPVQRWERLASREVELDLGPVGDVDGAAWREALGLAPDELPVAVVVEGTWWREEHTRRRLGRLDSVRELGIPDLFMGRRGEHLVLYGCPYGAPRTAEIIHVAARVGVRLGVQIGSCGVVGDEVRPGDVIVPTAALGLDGTTAHYATDLTVPASVELSGRASALLDAHDIVMHRGPTVTWPTLFNQPIARVEEWHRGGYLGVDMETATTLAVARFFGVEAASMLVAWDEVRSGRSFLDPLPEPAASAFAAADEAVFEVALELVDAIAG
jgi:uridine phosphorylase